MRHTVECAICQRSESLRVKWVREAPDIAAEWVPVGLPAGWAIVEWLEVHTAMGSKRAFVLVCGPVCAARLEEMNA
jgi:hypothetical protein